ncbi:Conserved hypothetical protein CHP04255 [Rhizobium sp. CF080]|uniref:TIGR04255 family protein n=1 Tax=Rhizobium sp. (strain CF080) TaxID=1144310 RepID=UPI0002717819|nr:TIGR04255 family protein [Rhizobium sp. CF080]EUB95863.1 Conserved hypothetical protein CHP04255 [Rhizobium sp. CF080]
MNLYSKPPIIECLIEMVPSEPFSSRDMGRLAKKLEPKYGKLEELSDYDVRIRVQGNSALPELASRRDWFRLFSKDGADVSVVNRKSYITSRLAPYHGWDDLTEKFERNLDLLEKTIGLRKWERVGVRYINRIDIPDPNKQLIDIKQYLNIYPSLPDGFRSDWTSTAVRVERTDASSGFRQLIGCMLVDPVLLKHQSYLLDIDIIAMKDMPVKRTELMGVLELIQALKNKTFEALVTDNARALFNA